MAVRFNTKAFEKQMANMIDYSIGFLEGAQMGKVVLMKRLGEGVIDALYTYIDLEARSNPAALQHVYEWYQTGSPAARLYELSYTVSNLGLSVKSNFTQSQSLSETSDTPFYNKAKIMESGKSITVKPKNSSVLVFEVDGETVFTSSPVTIDQPGGPAAEGAFEAIFDEFMLRYFKQSYLRSSGIYEHIKNPILYKKNFAAGSRMGKSLGVSTGFKWIANAGVGVGR